jgi:peptide/nickel transport system ATP-binding protein
MNASSIISVDDLTLALPEGADRAHALQGLSFDLQPREILCIVGESGSGKSLCAQTIMGLLPGVIRVERGTILFDGIDLTKAPVSRLRDLRGKRVSMIFQEPMTALNPSMRIGDQIEEVFEAHDLLTPDERRRKAVALATEVGLPNPEQIVRSFPHQLSGDDRDGVGAGAGPLDRRRTDDGSRRDDAGADIAAHPRYPAAARHVCYLHHP